VGYIDIAFVARPLEPRWFLGQSAKPRVHLLAQPRVSVHFTFTPPSYIPYPSHFQNPQFFKRGSIGANHLHSRTFLKVFIPPKLTPPTLADTHIIYPTYEYVLFTDKNYGFFYKQFTHLTNFTFLWTFMDDYCYLGISFVKLGFGCLVRRQISKGLLSFLVWHTKKKPPDVCDFGGGLCAFSPRHVFFVTCLALGVYGMGRRILHTNVSGVNGGELFNISMTRRASCPGF